MKLNATAKATLREAGISQAAWARVNFMAGGKWSGDECGCPDDRCANGFHHMGPDDCGCLPALIGLYFEWPRGAEVGMFDKESPEYASRVVVEHSNPRPAGAACGRCAQPVARPGETRPDGQPSFRARFCDACIGRCHEATDFAHICQICASPEEAARYGWTVTP